MRIIWFIIIDLNKGFKCIIVKLKSILEINCSDNLNKTNCEER